VACQRRKDVDAELYLFIWVVAGFHWQVRQLRLMVSDYQGLGFTLVLIITATGC
jgi:hypothetical protein